MLAVVKNPARAGISLEDVPMPEFSPWEVLLKVKAVGICGSDLRIYKGSEPNKRKNFILGHEVSGKVIDWGEKVHGVKKGIGLQPKYASAVRSAPIAKKAL